MASIHRHGKKWRVAWRERKKQRNRVFEKLLGPGGAKEFCSKVGALEQRPRRLTAVDSSITVKDYSERWLESVGPTVEAATLAGYATAIRRHVQPLLGENRVRDLDRGLIKEWGAAKLAERTESGDPLSQETVRRLHATLRAMLEWAVDNGLLDQNPAAKLGRKLGLVRSKRQRQEDKHPFSEEQRDLFHTTTATADKSMADLYFSLERAGLRLGEGIALRLGDVDLKRRELRVARSISSFNRETKKPKSGFARTVEMGEQLAVVLTRVTAKRRREGLKRGDINPLLFPSRAGTPYHHGNVERRFKKVLKAAGLPAHHTPHDLRHTYATLLLERGVDVNWLKDQLGHASIQLTVDEYGRWARARRGLASLLDRPSAVAPADATVV
jgi:integrase